MTSSKRSKISLRYGLVSTKKKQNESLNKQSTRVQSSRSFKYPSYVNKKKRGGATGYLRVHIRAQWVLKVKLGIVPGGMKDLG